MSKWLDMSLTCTQISFKNQQPASCMKSFNIASHMNCVFEFDGHKLFLGNIRAANDPSYLRQHEVGAVLSVIDTSDIKLEKSIIHLWIAAEDCEKVELIKYFDQASIFIRDHLKHTNVLVHCYAGISRSSSLILAYLMKFHGYTAREALIKVKCQRPQVDPNDGFMEQLKRYEQKIRMNHQHPSYSAGNNSVSKYLSTSTSTSTEKNKLSSGQSRVSISNFNIYSNLNSQGFKTNIKSLQLTTFNARTKPSYLDKSSSPANNLSTTSSKSKTFFSSTKEDPLKKYEKQKTVEQLWNKQILGIKNIYNQHGRQKSTNF